MRIRPAWACLVLLYPLVAGACYKQVPNQPVNNENQATEEAKKDLVKFNFGWEDGQRLRADAVETRKQNGELKSEVSASYSVEAKLLGDKLERMEGTANEMRVTFGAKLGELKAENRSSLLSKVFSAATLSAMPDIVVDKKGKLKKVENLNRVQAQFIKAARTAVGSGRLTPGITKKLKELLDKEALESRARQQWDMLVGLWAGDTFAVGEIYNSEVEDAFSLPYVGRKKMKMDVEFSVRERVACGATAASTAPSGGASSEAGGESASKPGCVRVTIKSKPDLRKMEEMMQTLVDKTAEDQAKRQKMKNAPDLTVKNFYLQTKVELVTDPSTLVPVEKTEKKTIRLKLAAPNGEEKALKSVTETKTTFN